MCIGVHRPWNLYFMILRECLSSELQIQASHAHTRYSLLAKAQNNSPYKKQAQKKQRQGGWNKGDI